MKQDHTLPEPQSTAVQVAPKSPKLYSPSPTGAWTCLALATSVPALSSASTLRNIPASPWHGSVSSAGKYACCQSSEHVFLKDQVQST